MPLDKQIGEQIAEEIQQRRIAAIEKAGGTFKRIAEQHAAIALCNVMDYYNPDGSLKPLNAVKAKARRAIKGIEQTKYGPRLLLWDKQEALHELTDLRGDKPAENINLNVTKPLVVIRKAVKAGKDGGNGNGNGSH